MRANTSLTMSPAVSYPAKLTRLLFDTLQPFRPDRGRYKGWVIAFPAS